MTQGVGVIFLVYYLPLTNMKLLLLLALATVVRGHGNMVKPLAIWDEQQGTIHLRLLQKKIRTLCERRILLLLQFVHSAKGHCEVCLLNSISAT